MQQLPKTMGDVEESPLVQLVKDKTGTTDVVGYIKAWRAEHNASLIEFYVAHGLCRRCRGRGYTFTPVRDLRIPFEDYPPSMPVEAQRCSPCRGEGTPGMRLESRRSR